MDRHAKYRHAKAAYQAALAAYDVAARAYYRKEGVNSAERDAHNAAYRALVDAYNDRQAADDARRKARQ
jgi:hypothetical protein